MQKKPLLVYLEGLMFFCVLKTNPNLRPFCPKEKSQIFLSHFFFFKHGILSETASHVWAFIPVGCTYTPRYILVCFLGFFLFFSFFFKRTNLFVMPCLLYHSTCFVLTIKKKNETKQWQTAVCIGIAKCCKVVLFAKRGFGMRFESFFYFFGFRKL